MAKPSTQDSPPLPAAMDTLSPPPPIIYAHGRGGGARGDAARPRSGPGRWSEEFAAWRAEFTQRAQDFERRRACFALRRIEQAAFIEQVRVELEHRRQLRVELVAVCQQLIAAVKEVRTSSLTSRRAALKRIERLVF
jgi:hypothetical protein